MYKKQIVTLFVVIVMTFHVSTSSPYFGNKYVECGQYGFSCEGQSKLRLCDGDRLFGPTFNCPSNSVCNEESINVCDNTENYIDPSLSRTLRCHRHERVVDPSVPGCKGYILCIPNKNHFQGIKLKCTGNTIFNGFTRTCSASDTYKCPLSESTTTPQLFKGHTKFNMDMDLSIGRVSPSHNRPIDCKSYKFAVTQDESLVRATYFCPPRPVMGESKVRCTVFSNQFCINLERDDPDQFIERVGALYRKPRLINIIDNVQ